MRDPEVVLDKVISSSSPSASPSGKSSFRDKEREEERKASGSKFASERWVLLKLSSLIPSSNGVCIDG